jgi:hypothetical protein
MIFVIRSSNAYEIAPEMFRICDWITERFGEIISIVNPCTFYISVGTNSKITEVMDLMQWDHSLVDILSLVYHESELGFAVYQILYINIAEFEQPPLVKIIVSFEDEMTALECKLACV